MTVPPSPIFHMSLCEELKKTVSPTTSSLSLKFKPVGAKPGTSFVPSLVPSASPYMPAFRHEVDHAADNSHGAVVKVHPRRQLFHCARRRRRRAPVSTAIRCPLGSRRGKIKGIARHSQACRIEVNARFQGRRDVHGVTWRTVRSPETVVGGEIEGVAELHGTPRSRTAAAAGDVFHHRRANSRAVAFPKLKSSIKIAGGEEAAFPPDSQSLKNEQALVVQNLGLTLRRFHCRRFSTAGRRRRSTTFRRRSSTRSVLCRSQRRQSPVSFRWTCRRSSIARDQSRRWRRKTTRRRQA